jgi:hypothetical protein
LTDGTGTAGDYYRVSAAGTCDFHAGNITFAIGDEVAYTGAIWEKWPGVGYTLQVAENVLGGVRINDAGDFNIVTATGALSLDATVAKTSLSLNLVENTALSTWAGTANVTTLGTITSLVATALRVGAATTYDGILISPAVKGANQFDLTITTADLTDTRTITLPDATGTVALTAAPVFTTSISTPKIVSAAGIDIELDPATTGVVKVTGQYYSPIISHLACGATETIDWNEGNEHRLVLNGACTLTFSNPVNGGRYVLIFVRDGTTFTGAVTFPAGDVWWPDGTAPTITATIAAVSIVTLIYDSLSAHYLGTYALDLK